MQVGEYQLCMGLNTEECIGGYQHSFLVVVKVRVHPSPPLEKLTFLSILLRRISS